MRIIRCSVNIADAVDGFNWVEGSREWNIEGKLVEKVSWWKEEDQAEREEDERRRMGRRCPGKCQWMMTLMTRRMVYRKRVRVMRMVLKRSKLRR